MHAGARDSDGNMRAYVDVENRTPAVSVPARKGTCILFDNLVFHGSGPNRSGRVRWSLDWRYASTLSTASHQSASESNAAKWWVKHMEGKQDDYGPVVVRSAGSDSRERGALGGAAEFPRAATLEEWLEKAQTFATAHKTAETASARL